MIYKSQQFFCNMKNNIKTRFVNYKNGPPSNLFVDERVLDIEEGQYLMKIKSIGINRAECLHRQGKYKIGKPQEAFLGLEASGQIYDAVTKQKLFDGIALLSGGSYAQWATVPKEHVMPLPKGMTFVEGAAIPQAWLTAFQLLSLADTKEGDSVVIYAGASGVGTAAIQICHLLKALPFAVVSGSQKSKICTELGAKVVHYKENKQWAQQLIKMNAGKRFSTVLDCVGSDNFNATLQLLDIDGKWILFGLLSGYKVDMNLALLLAKRIHLISTTLKTRSDLYKNQLISDFTSKVLQKFPPCRPIIFKTLHTNWEDVTAFVEAHTLMQQNVNYGKIMIEYI